MKKFLIGLISGEELLFSTLIYRLATTPHIITTPQIVAKNVHRDECRECATGKIREVAR